MFYNSYSECCVRNRLRTVLGDMWNTPRLHAYTLSMGVAVLYSCSNTVMLVNKLPVTMADLLHTCTVRLDEYNSILIIVEEAVNDKA